MSELSRVTIDGIDNLPRFVKMMRESIEKFELDLSGYVILTEAASSNFICTPVVAALAGAEKVYAYAKDTRYGHAADIYQNTGKMADALCVGEKIVFPESLESDVLKEADIVTNLGPLRPIARDIIGELKSTAIIPLMRETWEFRDGEIDLAACSEKGIVVMGTNENHPKLRIFDYLGHLCAKKMFEMGIEIFKSKILVLGGGEFGINITKYLELMGAEVESIVNVEDMPGADISNLDAIVVTTYPCNDLIIGSEGIIKPREISESSPGTAIVQFKGNVAREEILAENIRIIPEKNPKPGHMSWTLNDLGPKPVIDLHTAGLKVGEIVADIRKGGCGPGETQDRVADDALLQDFNPAQKKKYEYEFNRGAIA